MKLLRKLTFCFLLILGACSSGAVYNKAPPGLSLSGTWQFTNQDEYSLQHLINALNYTPLEISGLSNSDVNYSRRARSSYREQKTLRDLLVGLFSIVPKEIYIKQNTNTIAIDFGVAGYHDFNISTKTELIMKGIEVDAYAGWLKDEFILEIGRNPHYRLVNKFKIIGGELVETIELNVYGRAEPIVHQRIYTLDQTAN